MEQTEREYTKRASFEEYRLLLLAELDRISRNLREVNDKIDQFRREDVAQMKTDIAVLKFQAALYGAVAGLVATGLMYVVVKLIHV